ncbi:MAG: flagellar protein FlgN [Planctomycetes bacterium]|nr:flagellar protein FlgN [Planctomycetota bacterium]
MSENAHRRIDDLIKLLNRLSALHEDLLGVIRRKIDAMKRADIEGMREFGEQEQSIVVQIGEREGLRRQLMDLIGEDFKLPARSARSVSLKQLGARIPTAWQSILGDAGDRLRSCMTRVAAANRVAGEIARQVVTHLKWVFASVRPDDGEPVGYSRTGMLVSNTETRLFDAMG